MPISIDLGAYSTLVDAGALAFLAVLAYRTKNLEECIKRIEERLDGHLDHQQDRKRREQ